MIRVKLPFGGVTPEQMEAFADLAELYTPLKKGHITTRQNFQFHHIPLADAAKAIRMIGEAGLSSREACGNTVRNVTGDPWAGVCEGELFDPTPYVGAFVRYFVRNEVCQLLPRKFKVAFTATDEDRAITNIHDLGFVPRIREIDGQQVKGFEIRTGGGTSIMPRVGAPFWEFASVDDGEYLKVSEAVLRIFDRQERPAREPRPRPDQVPDRQASASRSSARMVDEELKGDWVDERDFDPDPLLFVDDEQAKAPGRSRSSTAAPTATASEFAAFAASNVQPQRQDGLLHGRGEGHARRPDARAVPRPGAQIMRDFTGGYARTTVHQNLLLRWVRDESVYDVWQRLEGARPRRRRRTPDHRRRELPRHRQLQARHHQLHGPQPGRAGAARADADRRPADASRST